MKVQNIVLEKVSDNLYEIPMQEGMKVPGRIYTSRKMIENYLSHDEAIKQVVNVAHLPGIQKYSLAMPDIHWGYGFPIGGVAATDYYEGVISPGGVGYDINCGVRLARTNLRINDVKNQIDKIIKDLFRYIPTGVGSSGAIRKLNRKELNNILREGADWSLKNGFATDNDITFTEENGCMEGAEPLLVSERAIERGLDQAGTLGSGNHFLEINVVDEIYDETIAGVLNLFEGQIVLQIHTGSRGLGYQICDDYLKTIIKSENKFGFKLPDRQLACAPIQSEEGQNYLGAMKCAANFAWNNRQIIMHLAKQSLKRTLSISENELNFSLVYDVAHNIAKIEEHVVDGTKKKLCVHRKGATRAFPAESPYIPDKYKSIGQPVLIPGDMGRYSFVAVGDENSLDQTFGSSCHGAGRVASRHKAIKLGKGKDLVKELNGMGVTIQAKGNKTIAEEMPYAYKDVSEVVDVMHNEKISKKIARLKPIGVIKG